MLRKLVVFGLAMTFSSVAFADKPDSWITTKTKLDLWTTSGVDSTEIDVDTIDGNVTLHGKVETAAAREKAEAEARKIDGVKSVRNLIAVVPDWREKAVKKTDKEIKESLENAFKTDDVIKDSGIEVRTVNGGIVLLGGKADNLEEQWHAVRTARATPGVVRVATEIKMPDGERYTDSDSKMRRSGKTSRTMHDGWTTTDVKMRLIADANVPALDVNVDTRDGVVKLFGNVPSDAAKRAAEKDALKVEGVTRVENDLRVVAGSGMKYAKKDDKKFEKDVKQAIDKNEGLSDVKVDVKGGVAHLTGDVSSRYKRLQASIAARSIPGVKAVSNDLEIKNKND